MGLKDGLPDDLTEVLEYSRNLYISDKGVDSPHEPFIITVQYLGISSAQKAIVLDNEIMPVITEAVEKWRQSRAAK